MRNYLKHYWLPLTITIIWMGILIYEIATEGIGYAFPLGMGGGVAVSFLWVFWINNVQKAG